MFIIFFLAWLLPSRFNTIMDSKKELGLGLGLGLEVRVRG
jgi:hypothetical protein